MGCSAAQHLVQRTLEVIGPVLPDSIASGPGDAWLERRVKARDPRRPRWRRETGGYRVRELLLRRATPLLTKGLAAFETLQALFLCTRYDDSRNRMAAKHLPPPLTEVSHPAATD